MSKVLLAYASEHGATAEIASTIGSTLRYRGLEVQVKRVENIASVTGYDAVIIGSAVYVDNWLPQAVDFLVKYVDDLQGVPTWFFSSGPTGDGDPLDLLEGVVLPDSITDIIRELEPRDIIVFGGKVDLRRLNKSERAIFKAVGAPKGDYRDWNTITEWANSIADALLTNAIVEKPDSDLLSIDE